MNSDVDVAIVGGGLAGCLAAACFARRGRRVAVIDRFAEPPEEFRAEQIVGAQIDAFRQRGLLDHLVDGGRITSETINAARGRVIDRSHIRQMGAPYAAMVRAARVALPPACFRAGKAVAIATSPTNQTVCCADGWELTARLVLLATGLAADLSQSLGVEQLMLSEEHSLTIGFDVELPGSPPHGPSWIYYGEKLEDRIDYLALFALGETMRANLFCYQQRGSDWARRLRENPGGELKRALPGLFSLLGPLKIGPRVKLRSNDLRRAGSVAIDGVLLIGDAFQTPCPAAGTGIDRILSDIAALERWLPTCEAATAFDAAAVSRFYRDPQKVAFDAECVRIARYRRAVSTQTTARWALHRWRVMAARRLKAKLLGM